MTFSYYQIIIVFTIILSIGIYNVLKQYFTLSKKIKFTEKYLDKFVQLCNSYDENIYNRNQSPIYDRELYIWLTLHVNKITWIMGKMGETHYFNRGLQVSNYSLLLNTLPKFRDRTLDQFDINSSQDCLLRFIGVKIEQMDYASKDIWNPLIWFREGMREIVSSPFTLLHFFGLIKSPAMISIKNSGLIKIISAIFSVIAAVSGIVTIITGYAPSLKFLKDFF